VQFHAAAPEPCAASRCERRGLGYLLKAEHVAIESAGRLFPARRHRELDLVNSDNVHRCCSGGFSPGLAQAFPQQEVLVTTWVVVKRCQSLKSALRVKGWSLEAERGEKDLPAAASASLVLCCPE
jgi:hypothetical protein